MKRLVLTACIAGFTMAGHLPSVMAAEDANAASDTKARSGKIKLAHVRSEGIKELAARSAVTKAAREVEAIEAVSGADSSRPMDAIAAAPAEADAVPVEAPAAEPRDSERKAADAKPKPMNTGHPHIDALVAVHAAANNIPEALIHRVIVRESKYQPNLVGRCGCIGLMQIKLGTARGLGYTGDAQGLHDPNTNLTYGVRYLAGAYRAARGDHDRAVAYFAKGYYEEAKRQRVADARPAGRSERVSAPLDITPKIATGRHARAH
ncbi:lytic transglycosylase domain-containing protein [Bradyrhizobium sp. SZCCHNR1002]|uniref:lytic transglycosylase domain-containing protein n=1 Tax=Bradyrhizobium sp. SZCCHNR1002 TaxID=3057334 RepID=UPI0028ED8D04|nr:lytic transglycosylase domain-containing protein [Bradyrhizobium sp. SZCCHNR1002]